MITEGDPRLDQLAELIAGSPHNLVARGERAGVRQLHISECVAIARALSPATGSRWVDVGSGGGLPGLVCALAYPDLRWTLVEATRKKAAAIRSFASVLGMGNVTVAMARAEDAAWAPEHRGGYEGVVSRAVAPLPTLVELCRGFVGDKGVVVAVKGPGWTKELGAAAMAIERLGLAFVRAVALPSPRPTWLVTMRAVGPPPDGYPRRAGVPQSRPIGGQGT